MSTVKVDLSGIEGLRQALADADKSNLNVGWFESANYDNGVSVAGVAALQEFGSKTAPARPFFRPAVEDNKSDWSQLVESGVKAVVEGNATMDNVMNGLGLTVQADIKNAIVGGNHLALSPVTIALRKLKNEGAQVGKGLVGAVAQAIAEGKTGPGELGSQDFGNKDPLRDSGMMIATLTYELS